MKKNIEKQIEKIFEISFVQFFMGGGLCRPLPRTLNRRCAQHAFGLRTLVGTGSRSTFFFLLIIVWNVCTIFFVGRTKKKIDFFYHNFFFKIKKKILNTFFFRLERILNKSYDRLFLREGSADRYLDRAQKIAGSGGPPPKKIRFEKFLNSPQVLNALRRGKIQNRRYIKN